ncbi:MAG: peptidoglycan DD-metalloendopeptidase family protein [Terriglobales bacterium]
MGPIPRRFLALAAAVVVLALAVGVWSWHAHPHAHSGAPRAAATTIAAPLAAAKPATVSHSVTIPARSNFVLAMAPFHLDRHVVQDLIAAARPVYDLTDIRAGRTLTLVRTTAGELKALVYQIDQNHKLWIKAEAAGMPPRQHAGSDWTASIETTPFTTRLQTVSGVVQSSLYQAIEDAGAHDELAVKMADIFGWDLDFNTDTRQGDVFKVLVEQHLLNGKFAGYGQIVAAEYINGGHPFTALRFHDAQGYLAYYRPDGRPMKREFLKSPLPFMARVTSGFSYHRLNPVLKIYRPHLGTDLAAPMHTPVRTIGAGVVLRAGWSGEDGRMVEVRHPHGYNTFYLHLSKVLVHVGQHVAQGQHIGLSGESGLATGPHLDFRIEHNGVFKNYEIFRLKLPPGKPIKARLMPKFEALRAQYMPELAQLQPAASATAATAATTPASSHRKTPDRAGAPGASSPIGF